MRKIHVINEKFIEVQIENVVHAVLSEIKKSSQIAVIFIIK